MLKISFEFWMVIFLLFFAGQKTIAQSKNQDNRKINLSDSTRMNEIATDSTQMSLIQSDSTLLKSDTVAHKENTLDAPVNMTSKDSMIMVMEGGNKLLLYGTSSVKYKEINLNAEFIQLNADSSILYAAYGLDTLGAKFGFPVFKDNSQSTEMEELWYNFHTKKMFTRNAITQQGEGFITAGIAKKMPDNSFFMKDGKYTTCDLHENPHFYFNLTKAKFRPNKNTVTGPAYLVVEDVPLPVAIPFGFFPASKEYSSGIIMPTYGDEMTRGFSLRDGGYYFALSNNMDLALTGEIYTKGSWGLAARSQYLKRYKYSGSFNASYLVTVLGDKDSKKLKNSDYSVSRDIKVDWSHRQDPKSNPYGTFTASVQFSTSSFNRNDLRSTTMNQMTENTKASSVSYAYHHPTLPLSINVSASVNQRSKDSTLTVSLPDMTISLSNIYPFKRKEQIGSERWYEKIYMSYNGIIRNSINDVKENQFLKKNVIKDWKNGIKHAIPISASFNLFKYITISTSFNYNENWYTNKTIWSYDFKKKAVVPSDTVYGFNRTYDYNGSVSMSTKLYGMYKPWSLFGKWTKGVIIRHVITPSVSFSGAPDFSNPKYGMYQNIYYYDQTLGRQTIQQPIYQTALFGGPQSGQTGAINFSLDNNLEMKAPIAGTDSTRKISLIDNFAVRTGYNFLADSLNWSKISASIRLKLFGTNIQLQGNFDPYLYGDNGRNINVLRLKAGKGIGRFMGTSTGISKTINNETLKKWFGKGGDDSSKNDETNSNTENQESANTEGTSGTDKKQTSLFKAKKQDGSYDPDGYLIFTIPWSFSFNYSVNLAYDMQRFNKETHEYPYKFSQTLGFNGNISPTKAWQFSFNASYDFDTKKIAYMNCSLSRQMHCCTMTASIVPMGPYQNYSFTIAVNSSLLQDFKYQQRSNYLDAMKWGD